jgi:hypothetical protein
MANTYLSGDNSRGNEVTAMGGTHAHFRGWDAGVKVQSDDGVTFTVYMTTGSHETGLPVVLGTVTYTPDGVQWTPVDKGE